MTGHSLVLSTLVFLLWTGRCSPNTLGRANDARETKARTSQESAELITTILIPGATGASTGLPTEDKGDGPWLMWAGTEVAHAMIMKN